MQGVLLSDKKKNMLKVMIFYNAINGCFKIN